MRLMLMVSIAALLALTNVASAGERYQIRDASDLVDICATSARQADAATALAFCHGFLVGAVQFYYAAVPEQSRFACAPNPSPSRSEVMNGFVAWAGAHPQHMAAPAAETLFRYLAETYPCP